jgi:transcriptional regulator with XRE-family HTH domain
MTSNIRRRRQELELSQYHVAFLTGIPQSRISLFERGLITLSEKDRKRIAKVLQVPFETITTIQPAIKVD